MLALSLHQTMHIPGILDSLIETLESTPSSSHRVRLIRQLARSHSLYAVRPIVPFLAGESRVRRAAIEALVSLGEDSRDAVLDVLGDAHRRELHPGAVVVLAALVRAESVRAASSAADTPGRVP
jgi:HEAT repeat protein